MENKEKTYGQILFEADKEWIEKDPKKTMYYTWENLPQDKKEGLEFIGNKLIQYYEDYLLREFLDRWRDDN